jgi:hypothetical protein
MKLGLLPHVPDERDIALASVYSPTRELPETFGSRGLDWGMLGNDEFGDCYWASAAHEVMAQAHGAGRSPVFSTEHVLDTYATYLGLYGHQALNESTDQGTDPTSGAKFRRKHGVVDARGDAPGAAHRIGAYAFETEPDYQKLLGAIYDFGAITLCFELPRSAEERFESGVWDYVKGSPIEGGHAVAGVARAESGRIVLVSWGQEVEVTEGFLEHYLQVAMAYISGSALKDGETPAGLDKPALLAALAALA